MANCLRQPTTPAAFGANCAGDRPRWRSNAPRGVLGRSPLLCSAPFGLIGIAAVFVQGPLRRVVEIPIVVDRVTGEATIQQRLSVETVPPLEALDKHNLATFVRAREGYHWQFLQRDFYEVARMAVPAVFAAYGRQFEGEGALHKRAAGAEDWRIDIVGVRLAASCRSRQSRRGHGDLRQGRPYRRAQPAGRDHAACGQRRVPVSAEGPCQGA